jgi:hypothetical protein
MSHAAAARSEIDIDEFERRLRGPSQRPVGDPLAELARLVSGHDEEKPAALDAIFARTAVDPVSTRQAIPVGAPPPVAEDLRGPFSDIHPGLDEAEEASVEPIDWSAAMAEPAVAETRRSRKPLYATAAVIAIGLLGIGGTFAFKGSSSSSGDLVEIKAAPGPTKVAAPAKPDSALPAKDSTVLDRSAQTPPVRQIVTRQEQPVDLSQVARAPVAAPISADGNAQQAAAGTIAEPRRVKTIAVRPDGTVVGAPVVTTPPPAAQAQPLPPPAPAARTVTPKSDNRVATTPAPEKPAVAKIVPPKPAVPKIVARPEKPEPAKVARADAGDNAAADNAPAAAAAPVANVASGGGGFSVQLAAPGTEAEARQMAGQLAAKYDKALGGAHLTFRKATDKPVYRVRAAGLSHEAAVAVCERIKAAGGPCFVAKN